MARVEGVDPKQTSFLMRQVFKKVRKMLGRDLTPQKITARVPRVFWAFAPRMAARSEDAGPATPTVASDAANGGARRVSVLNRRQFCRRQNVRIQ